MAADYHLRLPSNSKGLKCTCNFLTLFSMFISMYME
nr:MAG TPA: hypothetical protein [Caudoviricetes sp.]